MSREADHGFAWLNFTDLQKSIAAGESQTLELKKSTAEKERACRSLCALANGQGGQVVLGVAPSGKVGRWLLSRAVISFF